MTHLRLKPEPVAWRYEVATNRIWEDGKPTGWGGWEWRLTEREPCVPEGSIRNLTPIYAAPAQPETDDRDPDVEYAMGRFHGRLSAIRDAAQPEAMPGREEKEAAAIDRAMNNANISGGMVRLSVPAFVLLLQRLAAELKSPTLGKNELAQIIRENVAWSEDYGEFLYVDEAADAILALLSSAKGGEHG